MPKFVNRDSKAYTFNSLPPLATNDSKLHKISSPRNNNNDKLLNKFWQTAD